MDTQRPPEKFQSFRQVSVGSPVSVEKEKATTRTNHDMSKTGNTVIQETCMQRLDAGSPEIRFNLNQWIRGFLILLIRLIFTVSSC